MEAMELNLILIVTINLEFLPDQLIFQVKREAMQYDLQSNDFSRRLRYFQTILFYIENQFSYLRYYLPTRRLVSIFQREYLLDLSVMP